MIPVIINKMVSIVLQRELNRYKSKGLWIPAGLAMLIFYFCIFPSLFKPVYAFVLSHNWQKEYLVIFSNYFLHIIVFVGANCVYYVLYHFEWPSFEKYKSSKYPWPWNEDKDFWSGM